VVVGFVVVVVVGFVVVVVVGFRFVPVPVCVGGLRGRGTETQRLARFGTCARSLSLCVCLGTLCVSALLGFQDGRDFFRGDVSRHCWRRSIPCFAKEFQLVTLVVGERLGPAWHMLAGQACHVTRGHLGRGACVT
jgi:hypothetical protein